MLGKSLLIFVVWKLSYHLYLGPHKTIDRPLTNFTAKSTSYFVSFFEKKNTISWQIGNLPPANEFYKATIFFNGQRALGIADPCNALELFILFIGYLICFPATIKRFIIFTVFGCLVIFFLNIVRCSCMFWLNIYKSNWFHFAHHYAFKLIVYSVIFTGWYLYSIQFSNGENK